MKPPVFLLPRSVYDLIWLIKSRARFCVWLKSLGLTGHLPIVLVVNGQYRHQRANGSTVEFVSFPVSPGGAGGESTKSWSVEDAKAVLAATLGK
jgi:hypothetical protein